MKTAILLSGGIDSTALAYWKRPDCALTIDYGQLPAEAEVKAAALIASSLNIGHEVLRIDLRKLGSGLLVGGSQSTHAPSPEWWPYRNQLLITLGAMFALREECGELILGTVSSDALHSDGSPAFLERMNSIVSSQEGGLKVTAPAAHLGSAELVKASMLPSSLLAWCHSCHRGNLSCGQCRGCQKNRNVRNASGLIT